MSVKWMWQLWEAFSSHLFLLWRTHKHSRMELQPTFITCAHSEPRHQIEPLDCWGDKLEASFVSHFHLYYFPPNWKHALNCKTKFSGGKLLTAIAFPLSNFVWRCKDAVCRLECKTASWWKILEQYSLERLKHPVKKILCYSHWLAKAWHTRDMTSSAGRRCHSLEAIRHCIYWQHGEPMGDRCSLNSSTLPRWCRTGNPWIYPWTKNSPPTRNCQIISRKSLCTFLISVPLQHHGFST